MNRVFACTDFHGIKSNYDQINNFIDDTDIVYFLGDAADRGPNGWEIIKDLINNKNWKWLMGNHDQMLTNRILNPTNRMYMSDHEWNGGSITWLDVEDDYEVLGENKILEIARTILNLPTSSIYENKNGKIIYMSHSGYIGQNEEDLVWDRTHFYYPISDYTNEKIDYVIHGHTPIQYLVDELKQFNTEHDKIAEYTKPCAYWYCNNTKCDLDNLTAFSGDTVLLDLDTFEEKIFHTNIERDID